MSEIPTLNSRDPFHIIREDIDAQYNETQQKFNRFHMLVGTQEWATVRREIGAECDSIQDQLLMLREAVDTTAENPERFNITMEEINSLREWLEITSCSVSGIKTSVVMSEGQKENVYQQLKNLTCEEIEDCIPRGCRGISRTDIEEKSNLYKAK
jgi:hypothetical protein